jgi:actin-related protein 5
MSPRTFRWWMFLTPRYESTTPPTWTLLRTLKLDEDQLKEKRKQKLLKAGWEARMKARSEKQREKEEREADERREAEDRGRDPVAWAAGLRKTQEVSLLHSESTLS